ncbi:MAG: PTS transporter subunit EIIC [Anaerostipes sp.]|jgi:PTS system beta-glucosides-specific IIC component
MKSKKVLVENLLDLLGGGDNIISMTHCATRLRPQLKDSSIVNVEAIEKLEGVTGVVNQDAGVQIIIGLTVGQVYDEFMKIWNKKEISEKMNENHDIETKKKNIFNEFVATMVAIFSPLLPLLAGSGLLRGFTILANQIGILSETSTTNLVLTCAGTAVFTFLPILVAFTSAKRFEANPYIATAIMGALIMPAFLALVKGDGGNLIQLFGVSIPVFNYTGQVIPAIITTWVQSKIEHFMEKRIPTSLHMIIIPTVLLFILVPLYAAMIGPAGNFISIGMAQIVNWLENINPIITGGVIGGIWNILIMFGVHWAPNTMVIIPEIAAKGYSPLIAYGATANFGMAGAALAVFLKSKNKELKNFSITAIASVMFSGIVEPAIYGLGVKYKTPLVAGCIGAALGGAFMGIFHTVGYAFVFGGLTTIPAFAGTTLWSYVVGLVISFVAGMVLTFVFGIKDPEAQM